MQFGRGVGLRAKFGQIEKVSDSEWEVSCYKKLTTGNISFGDKLTYEKKSEFQTRKSKRRILLFLCNEILFSFVSKKKNKKTSHSFLQGPGNAIFLGEIRGNSASKKMTGSNFSRPQSGQAGDWPGWSCTGAN